jgi:hypothetical protein
MRKPDYAHKLTDKQLADLEQRIAKLYKEAADELTDTVKSYFEQFAKRDAAMQEKLDAGEITEQQYKQWRLAQIGRGERFKALRDKVATRYTDANATAVAYVNDATPGIYSLNRNYAAYKIEQVSDKADFTLWDEQTVKRLIVEQPDLMPYYPPKRALQRGIDLKYGKQQITASVTSSILQGKGIGKIADDLQSRMRDMSRASAIRTARTAVTAAENAGRLDTYRSAQDMGIKLKKQWVATLDNRTRHAHAVADGQTVDVEKPFIIDGYKLMKPGDESAPGYLVYNCRCTTIADLPDVPKSRHELRRAIDPETGRSVLVPYMNYTQWDSWKEAENRYAWETYMKKGRNFSSDKRQFAEYRKVLGDKVPDSVYKFQDLKYNDIEIWHALKTLKKQTIFVEKAQCETTERKFKEYLLKPGAKHAKEFFDVGYTAESSMQLRYDIAKQYDESKVQNVIELEDGSKKYSIPMKLGITEKKQFLTCWIKEPGNGKPRITTAYRKDADK